MMEKPIEQKSMQPNGEDLVKNLERRVEIYKELIGTVVYQNKLFCDKLGL